MSKLFELISIAKFIRIYDQEYLDEILDGLKEFLVFDGREIDNPRIILKHEVVSVGANSIEGVMKALQEQIKASQPDGLLFFCHMVQI